MPIDGIHTIQSVGKDVWILRSFLPVYLNICTFAFKPAAPATSTVPAGSHLNLTRLFGDNKSYKGAFFPLYLYSAGKIHSQRTNKIQEKRAPKQQQRLSKMDAKRWQDDI